MNEIHIHLHLADASNLNLRDLISQAQAGEVPPVRSTEPETKTLYVAVYRSMRQRFALGHKLYDSEEGARRNSEHPNFQGTASFTIDLSNERVIGYNGPNEQRYWAVLEDDGVFSLGRNSYTDLDRLDEDYEDRYAVLAGEAVDGRVSLAGV